LQLAQNHIESKNRFGKEQERGFKCLPNIVKGYLVSPQQYTSLGVGSPCPYFPLITYHNLFYFWGYQQGTNSIGKDETTPNNGLLWRGIIDKHNVIHHTLHSCYV
jgi:hypothetical protein